MILRTIPPTDTLYDVIVVGAGAIGLTLAIRLAQGGQSVCVIETGTDTLAADYQTLNSGKQSGPRKHLGLERGRYKGLGGTTRLWGGQLMPFSPADFSPNPAHNKPGWQFTYDDISPWIDDALDMLGIKQSTESLEAKWCRKTGQPLEFGTDLKITPSVWMKKPDFNQHFSDVIAASGGPQIILGHEAIGTLADDADGRITGVWLRDEAGEEHQLRARSTVLACGTLEISRMLLRAKGQLPQTPLGKNRHVGKWFIDHLHGVAGTIHPQNRKAFGAIFDTFYAREHKITPKISLSETAMEANALSNCAMTINAYLGPGEAIAELRGLARRIGGGTSDAGRSLGETARSAQILAPLAWRYLTSRRSGKFLSGNTSLGVEVEQLPSSESYIALEEGIDPVQAEIVVHWSVAGSEMEAVAHCAKATKATCEARGLGEVELDPLVEKADPAFFDKCTDSSHQAGGARMAKSAEDGVVDGNCQVFGMPGLYVAGAATFPSGSFANPTLTAIATGLRLAKHLSGSPQ